MEVTVAHAFRTIQRCCNGASPYRDCGAAPRGGEKVMVGARSKRQKRGDDGRCSGPLAGGTWTLLGVGSNPAEMLLPRKEYFAHRQRLLRGRGSALLRPVQHGVDGEELEGDPSRGLRRELPAHPALSRRALTAARCAPQDKVKRKLGGLLTFEQPGTSPPWLIFRTRTFRELNVPIGLPNVSCGHPVESWMSEAT